MIKELIETKRIIANFDKMVSDSPYKTEYISSRINIPLPTFYRKLRDNKFTIDEIIAILEVIHPEQYQYEMLSENIKMAEDQIKNGDFIEEKDFIFDVETIIANRQ
jgi:predicted transcriptional regulator